MMERHPERRTPRLIDERELALHEIEDHQLMRAIGAFTLAFLIFIAVGIALAAMAGRL